jgi:nucleoid-associated protein YgaU
MKPVTVIAVVIVVLLIGLGIVFWQLGVFSPKNPETTEEFSEEPITPTDLLTITSTGTISGTGTELATPNEMAPTNVPEMTESTYTVKPGDTLEGISKQVYGDGSKWRLIQGANKKVDPKKLKVGMVLTIPPAGGTVRHGSESGMGLTENAVGGEGSYYTVQKGDSLSKIAKHFYGDANKYRLIQEANRDKLPTKDTMLKIGWRLFIPKEGGKTYKSESHSKTPASGTSTGSGGAQPQDNVPVGSGD